MPSDHLRRKSSDSLTARSADNNYPPQDAERDRYFAFSASLSDDDGEMTRTSIGSGRDLVFAPHRSRDYEATEGASAQRSSNLGTHRSFPFTSGSHASRNYHRRSQSPESVCFQGAANDADVEETSSCYFESEADDDYHCTRSLGHRSSDDTRATAAPNTQHSTYSTRSSRSGRQLHRHPGHTLSSSRIPKDTTPRSTETNIFSRRAKAAAPPSGAESSLLQASASASRAKRGKMDDSGSETEFEENEKP